MSLRTRFRRFAHALVLLGAAWRPDAALAADGGVTSIERLGQGIKNIGRQLDVSQLFGRHSADVEDEAPPPSSRDGGAASVRIDRLESQIRSLTGLVEQLQYDIHRLEDQLRRTQAEPYPPRGASSTPQTPSDQATAGAASQGLRRGDAFDPGRDPNAAGAPKPLGSTAPSAPLAGNPYGGLPGTYARPSSGVAGPAAPAPAASDLRSPGAPLDLTHGRLNEVPPPAPPAGAQAPTPNAAAPVASLGAAPSPPQTPKDEFDLAVSRLRQGEYEAAEKGFSAFLAKNSKSKLAPQATFDLGESFFLRARYREAAEKYLEISTKYASSSQAPEAMLRLGQSLHALGAKEQACASFSEIAVKYPGAAARIKEGAQRESKKVQC